MDNKNRELIAAGASLHWLVPGQKRPIADAWLTLPNQSESDLRANHREGANIGIRLGQPSQIGDFYLHLIDLDVRDASKAAEAWAALLDLWPAASSFPGVISGSGSGGESRHIYFLSPVPMRKRKLAKGDGWEIDLMGTESQAVLPPSIHPVTKLPYIWERPLDLTLSFLMRVEADQVAIFGARQDMGGNGETVTRLDQVNSDHLARLFETLDVDDRDDWKDAGMALHHQFAGSKEGYTIWNDWAKVSEKHKERDSRTVWKSFNADKPGALGLSCLFDRAGIEGYSCGLMVMDDDFDGAPDLPGQHNAAKAKPAALTSATTPSQ